MTVDRGPHPVAWGRFWSIWDDGLFLPRVEATISADMSLPRMAVEAPAAPAGLRRGAHRAATVRLDGQTEYLRLLDESDPARLHAGRRCESPGVAGGCAVAP